MLAKTLIREVISENGREGHPQSTDPGPVRFPISALKLELSWIIWVAPIESHKPLKAVNFPWLEAERCGRRSQRDLVPLGGPISLQRNYVAQSPRRFQFLFIIMRKQLFPGTSFFQGSFHGFKRMH